MSGVFTASLNEMVWTYFVIYWKTFEQNCGFSKRIPIILSLFVSFMDGYGEENGKEYNRFYIVVAGSFLSNSCQYFFCFLNIVVFFKTFLFWIFLINFLLFIYKKRKMKRTTFFAFSFFFCPSDEFSSYLLFFCSFFKFFLGNFGY